MKLWTTCVLACATFGCAASTADLLGQEEVLVLEVARETVSCVGEMVGRCIQVRDPGEGAWQIFYDPIEGFQHEAGVLYTLEVGRRGVSSPLADGSAYAYRLIRVLSRDPPAG